MDEPRVYEIRVAGQLSERWSDWLGGLAIYHDDQGQMTLSGPLVDQADLLGVLTRIHALNLVLISVKRLGN